jgi:hypothetical protein
MVFMYLIANRFVYYGGGGGGGGDQRKDVRNKM